MTKIPTKVQLLAAMRLKNAVVCHERPSAIYELGEPYTDYHQRQWQPLKVVGFTLNPTDHLQICHDGFIARIFSSGRVILDVGASCCGELFDAKAKGRTLEEKRRNAIKLLHAAIRKSRLN